MSHYDQFIFHAHGKFTQLFFQKYNSNIAKYLFPKQNVKTKLLEIGPGKGYFIKAVSNISKNINITIIDQNKSILNAIKTEKKYQKTIPPFPKKIPKIFNIIYAAFIIEHLETPKQAHEFVLQCKQHLITNGKLILLCPNALRQGIEFWNEDYTHILPTTERTVSQLLTDVGYTDISIISVHPLAIYLGKTPRAWKMLSMALDVLFWWYSYRMLSFITNTSLSSIDNFWYKIHILLKTTNLFIVAKK